MRKHHKKQKKHKKSKRRESSSSSEEEWVEAKPTQRSHQNKQYQKRQTKKHRSSSESSSSSNKIKNNTSRRSSSPSSSVSSDDEKPERKNRHEYKNNESPNPENQNNEKRDEWMNLSTSFSSYSNRDKREQKEQARELQKQNDKYNPSKCPRELNPYWKDGGDGLPKFKKPKYDSDDEDNNYKNKNKYTYKKSESNWRKKSSSSQSEPTKTHNTSQDNNKIESKPCSGSDKTLPSMVITEKELNLLAGKLVKAEIMGNETLVRELKEKLETSRKALEESKSQGEEVLLIHTDKQGHSKPLELKSEYGESSGSKKRKKAATTHNDKERVRYFPDDDKYSLKQMFENEKFNNSYDQDSEFMKIASNIRKNDDLDDFFTDNIRRKSDSKTDESNRNKAINEHKSMTESLENCQKCIQSNFMQKHLIVSMGEYIYLSLPSHEPLTEGHCMIIPIRHVSCATQLDENEWSEILDFRKALVRLAQSKNQDTVFFEIATGFHKYPHMVLECVPLPKEDGDMAPIYFKKAIDESETEWAQNKKLVSLKGRNVRKAIPKGLPYFCVSFGMEEGFAHVVEDEKLFPRNFAQEIIGGMLDLHHSKWRKPSRESFTEQSKRVLNFSNEWKNYDCTAAV